MNVLRGAFCVSKIGTRNPQKATLQQPTLQKLHCQKKDRINAAFTACTAVTSLLETVTDAAEIAARLATMMLSTARSSFEDFQNARNSGQTLYILVKSISWGRAAANPNISGEISLAAIGTTMISGNNNFSFRAFLREKHEANHSIIQTSLQKGRDPRQINE
jgi:hypothetical protein